MHDRAEPSLPALLRGARGVFGAEIRDALARAGHDDIPANGLFVIGAIARGAAPLADIITLLGMSKQAAGHLVDTIASRGYLERSVDAADRRRFLIGLTERGRAAAKIIQTVVDRIEAELTRRVGPEAIAHTRATLHALIASAS
jgi:DNA-binding MarR family transcriptional regulator